MFKEIVATSNVFIIQRRFYHLYQRLDNQLYFSSSKLAQRFSVVNRNNSCIQIRYFSFSWMENLAVTQSKYFQALSSSDIVLKTMDTLQYVHDTTHLPWWLSIVITTAFLRTAITLPLAAFQNYIIAKIENLRPEMDELIKVLKKETAFAIKKFQWDEKYARIMYNRSARKLWKDLIVKENCHPFKTTILLFVQLPMWIILSAAFRNMATMMPHFDTKAWGT
ncbi:Mitochondrial inner membrane protein COX18 [Armadillidium nasatum]|uniref:Mitochondrial inner membrane protein COX18 n=1 Tax=Armadillidium nasatum TaxID=96803 RepID=A0A5N5TER7_9CRUS|nr:Mitochondrial inner membrane protein COX18 [Armadillidium nasatum]